MFITLGDIMMHAGDTLSTVGDIMHTSGGTMMHVGYHEFIGGDIMGTFLGFQHIGVFNIKGMFVLGKKPAFPFHFFVYEVLKERIMYECVSSY